MKEYIILEEIKDQFGNVVAYRCIEKNKITEEFVQKIKDDLSKPVLLRVTGWTVSDLQKVLNSLE